MADLNQQLFQQLARIAFSPVSRIRKPSDYDVALEILKNSQGKLNSSRVWSPALAGNVAPKPKKGGGSSLFGNIVDVLLRPMYASASAYKASGGVSSGFGFYKHLLQGEMPENPLDALKSGAVAGWKGLKGDDKTTYSQIIHESDDIPKWMKSGVAGFATGLGADILGDPLTYVPIVGPTKAAVRAGYQVAGKEAPYLFLPKATKQAMKAAKVGTPRFTEPSVIVPSNKVPKAFQATTKALEDAPVVNTALEQGTKEAAVAEHILSPQQAALAGKEFNKEAEAVLKAANVDEAGQKAYERLMKEITFKSRGPVQNAIDKNASKLTIPISNTTRKTFRGSGGRFLKNGTLMPTVGKNPRSYVNMSGYTDRSLGIFGKFNVQHSAEVAARRKATKEILESSGVRPKPAPKPKAVKDVFGPVNTAVSNALKESAGIPIVKLKPGQTIAERDAVHGIVSRFATWAGQKDLRPMVLDNMASAVARASQRAKAMEAAFKGFKENDVLEAWEIARNAKPRGIASSPDVVKLADVLTGQMEQFFRSRAVPEGLAKGNSMAMRSGMTMKDINNALKRYRVPFQFTAGDAIDPVTQKAINYGHRTNWLISWETHAPKNVQELKRFMFGLHSAAEQVAAKYAFLDDVAYRMGSRGKTATKRFKIDHPRLVDYYFDKEIADQLSTALKTMDQFYSPKSPVTRFMRQALSTWKTGVTIYNPRHHIANIIGDTFLMWMAGINDPRVFSKAAKVMFANKGLYKDLASVDVLVGRNAIKNSLAKPGSIVARNKNGHGFTAQQVYTAAFNYGLLQKAGVIEDIAKEGLPLGRLGRPFKGAVHNKVASLAENREHYVKLAHFIGEIEKSRGKNALEIFENAAHVVRKWHPDGLDLTKEEQAIRAIGIPFYSWLRKSTPLVIEGALMNPNKAFTSYAKTGYNLQQSLGIQGTTPSDPYPDDQLFPAWLRDDNVPVLGKTSLPGIAGTLGRLGRQGTDDQGNPLDAYTMLGPTNPVQDFFTQFGGFRGARTTADAALSQINPMFRIPLEVQQGKELYTGIPLEGRGGDYVTNQIPMVNQVARMTNVSPFGKTQRGEKFGVGNREATINWFTNANLTGTGPYIKSAEFEQIPKQREENKRIRQFSAQIGYPLTEKGKIPEWIRELYYQRNGR